MSGDIGDEEQVSKVEASSVEASTISTSTNSLVTNVTSTITAPTTSNLDPSTISSKETAAPVSPLSNINPNPSTSWTSPVTAPGVVLPQDIPEEEAEENVGDTSCAPERVYISPENLVTISKTDLTEKWTLQEKFLDCLQNRMESLEREVEELHGVRENEERLKGQLAELQRKEQYHIMRLSSKEHEIQDMGAQIQELKNMSVGVGGLRNCLLDPAVNLLFERLKRDLDSARTKMEETQNELSAWKFTPDSNTGKQLMAKCRLLIKENEELGRMITSGRLAKLEGELALQRNYSEELKKSQSELDEFLLEMDEDTEGMQGTIYYLQQQLRQAKERIAQLSSQLSVNQNPASQPGDESNSQMMTEDSSEINEMERTEVPLVPQPNGDASSHEETNAECDVYESDIMASTSVSCPPLSSTPSLTNGNKRTRSELDGVSQGEGETRGVGLDAGHEDLALCEADDVPLQKRTRIDVEAEQAGVEDQSTLLENGVTE